MLSNFSALLLWQILTYSIWLIFFYFIGKYFKFSPNPIFRIFGTIFGFKCTCNTLIRSAINHEISQLQEKSCKILTRIKNQAVQIRKFGRASLINNPSKALSIERTFERFPRERARKE